MIHGGESAFGTGTAFSLLVVSTVVLVVIAARVYPPVVTQRQAHAGAHVMRRWSSAF